MKQHFDDQQTEPPKVAAGCGRHDHLANAPPGNRTAENLAVGRHRLPWAETRGRPSGKHHVQPYHAARCRPYNIVQFRLQAKPRDGTLHKRLTSTGMLCIRYLYPVINPPELQYCQRMAALQHRTFYPETCPHRAGTAKLCPIINGRSLQHRTERMPRDGILEPAVSGTIRSFHMPEFLHRLNIILRKAFFRWRNIILGYRSVLPVAGAVCTFQQRIRLIQIPIKERLFSLSIFEIRLVYLL